MQDFRNLDVWQRAHHRRSYRGEANAGRPHREPEGVAEGIPQKYKSKSAASDFSPYRPPSKRARVNPRTEAESRELKAES